MPKASDYPIPTGGPLGEEIRESLADLVTRITTSRNQSSLSQCAQLITFLNSVEADLTAFNATVGIVTTATISTDNVVTAAEQASPVPVASTIGGTILAGDTLRISVTNSAGVEVRTANSAALAAGATSNTTNVSLSGLAVGIYTFRVYVVSQGVVESVYTRQFQISA